jgi:hypothetical protein
VLLGTKIVSIAVASVFVTAVTGLLIQRTVIRSQGIAMTRDAMRGAVLSAENSRQSVANMWRLGVFDQARLKTNAAAQSDYRQSNLFKTIPVVAAFDSISGVSAKEGYEFRIAAHHPRNPNNAPRGDEEAILQVLEGDLKADYFAVDAKANEMVYARPIELTADCLMCHGDPGVSKSGKDMLGFPMEGWHAGDRHGAFVLRAKLDHVDAAVKAAMLTSTFWLGPLSLCIGFGVYLLISRMNRQFRTVIQSVADGAAQMKEAIAQVSAASHALAQGATEQAASLEETSASGEEIASITRKNADSAQLAAEQVDLVDRSVHEANGALVDMGTAMHEINASSGKIGNIIKVIDAIAFQTNILALNAAVEAARAGGAGAGFAVVAGEVRSLAQRSAKAAKETAALIEDSITKSSEGSAKLSHMEGIIRTITDSSAKVKVAVDEVNVASQEQTRGAEQIARALLQMDQVTQAAAASAEQTASACEELAAQTLSMNTAVQGLRTVVGG